MLAIFFRRKIFEIARKMVINNKLKHFTYFYGKGII